MDRFPTLRKRSELLHCDKCIKLKLIDFWCGNDTFCHSVQNQGLIYFADWHHPSSYGFVLCIISSLNLGIFLKLAIKHLSKKASSLKILCLHFLQ